MTTTFNRKIGPIDTSTLILASLVERETKTAVDRPIVAGILLKRLKAGWPLQIDATVQYAYGDWSPSPIPAIPLYNTYIHTGLPPTPSPTPA